jgi:hypothetical protein
MGQRMQHALQHQLLLTPYAGSSGNSSVLHCGIMPHRTPGTAPLRHRTAPLRHHAAPHPWHACVHVLEKLQ